VIKFIHPEVIVSRMRENKSDFKGIMKNCNGEQKKFNKSNKETCEDKLT
jgi:hypothetical protein